MFVRMFPILFICLYCYQFPYYLFVVLLLLSRVCSSCCGLSLCVCFVSSFVFVFVCFFVLRFVLCFVCVCVVSFSSRSLLSVPCLLLLFVFVIRRVRISCVLIITCVHPFVFVMCLMIGVVCVSIHILSFVVMFPLAVLFVWFVCVCVCLRVPRRVPIIL